MFLRKKWKQLASAEDTFYLQRGKDVWQFSRVGSEWAANRIPRAGDYLKGIPSDHIERGARIAAAKDSVVFSDKSRRGLYVFRHGPSGWQLEQEISTGRPLAGLHDLPGGFRYEWLSLSENTLAFWMTFDDKAAAVGFLSRGQAGWQLDQLIPATGLGYELQKDEHFVPCLTLAGNVLAIGRVDTGLYQMIDLCLIRRASDNTWQAVQKIGKQSLQNCEAGVSEEGIFWQTDLALHDRRLALAWDAFDKANSKWEKTVGVFRCEQEGLIMESKLRLGSLEAQMNPYFQQGYSDEIAITGMRFTDAETLFTDFMKIKLSGASWQLDNTSRPPRRMAENDKPLLDDWNNFGHGGASLLQVKKDRLLFYRYEGGCHELEQIIRAGQLPPGGSNS